MAVLRPCALVWMVDNLFVHVKLMKQGMTFAKEVAMPESARVRKVEKYKLRYQWQDSKGKLHGEELTFWVDVMFGGVALDIDRFMDRAGEDMAEKMFAGVRNISVCPITKLQLFRIVEERITIRKDGLVEHVSVQKLVKDYQQDSSEQGGGA